MFCHFSDKILSYTIIGCDAKRYQGLEELAMNAKKSNNCIYFLGFLLFFVLVLPFKSNTITAYANSNVEMNTTKETQPEIKLNVKSKSLVKEKSYNLRVYNVPANQKVSYKSSDSSIASVDEEGTVTGVEYGTTTITVTVKDGNKTTATLTCDITVGPPAISVKLTRSELLMVVGKRMTLKTILQPYNTVEEIKFTTGDSTIATVSPGGRISANAIGTTYVFALIDNGKYDACKVTVVDEETYQNLLDEAALNESTEKTENDGSGNVTVTPTISPVPTK